MKIFLKIRLDLNIHDDARTVICHCDSKFFTPKAESLRSAQSEKCWILIG